MDKRLHLLETFPVRGDDGKLYVVRGYEHLARLDGTPDLLDQWEPTGESEYKLEDGQSIEIDTSGAMKVARSGMKLTREDARRSR